MYVLFQINVHEKTHDRITQVKVNGIELSHKFQTTYGGIYDIKVFTDVPGAEATPIYTYQAPPLLPPLEVAVTAHENGTYIVTWTGRDLDDKIGSYKYEVLVSDGPVLNEATALKFEVDEPPFYFSNDSSDTYTFAVRLQTQKGYKSLLSESLSSKVFREATADTISKTSLTWILVPTLMLILVLVVILGVLFIRHRRLQNSFTR